jgi:hypothetical protein
MDGKRERSVKLTKSKLDDLGPAATDRFLWDKDVRGFGVRVTPKGVKSFVL